MYKQVYGFNTIMGEVKQGRLNTFVGNNIDPFDIFQNQLSEEMTDEEVINYFGLSSLELEEIKQYCLEQTWGDFNPSDV